MVKRRNVCISSHGETLAGWIYPASHNASSSTVRPGPGIILAHGLSATKEMRLDAYAERFSAAGYTTLAFDYSCNGKSTGKPRGLIDIKKQYQDWLQAIKFFRCQAEVDGDQVAIFSITFGSLNLIKVAAHDTRLKAVICQCPLLKNIRSSKSTLKRDIPRLAYLGFKDYFIGTDDHPITVPLHSTAGHGERTCEEEE